MKKIYWLIILFANSLIAQELIINSKGDTIILNSDKTWQYKNSKSGYLSIKDFENSKLNSEDKIYLISEIIVKDGAENDVRAKFIFLSSKESWNRLGIQNVNNCTHNALIKTKYLLKNKYTFIPREINWYYADKGAFIGKWMVTVKYSAQNDYGALKDGEESIFFNEDGSEFIF